MTKVFVWKNYGKVSVYAFETSKQQSALCYDVYRCALNTVTDHCSVAALDKIYDQDISFAKKIEKLLKRAQGDAFDNETFEHGTGFVEVQE